MNEFLALHTLFHTPQLGPVRIRKLIQEFGSCLNACQAKDLKQNDHAKRDLEIADKCNVSIIAFFDPLYPKELLSINNFPPLIYVKGKFNNQKKIAIVGTRNATIYGLETARKIAHDLSLNDITIVSGLARGIDTEAHIGALKSGYTYAVLGSGLLNIYPKENISLASEIKDNGILISEFAMQTPPSRENFPKRNRIVSGLSESILLIEAPKKSGAMLTMEIAKGQNKKLFALPGRTDSSSFEGNLELLHSGAAKIARNATDLIGQDKINNAPLSNIMQLSKDEAFIIKLLPSQEISIEELSRRADLPISKLNVVLMGLVLKKVIREYPGKIYKLCEC
jgi:DNA processing protein